MSAITHRLTHVDRTVIVQTQSAVTIVGAIRDTHLHMIDCIASVSDSTMDNLYSLFVHVRTIKHFVGCDCAILFRLQRIGESNKQQWNIISSETASFSWKFVI